MERKNDFRISAPDPRHGSKEVQLEMSADTSERQARTSIQHQPPQRSYQKAARPISRKRRRIATSGLIAVLLGGLVMPVQGIGGLFETRSAGFLPTAYVVPHGMSVKTFAKRLYLSHGATLIQWKCLDQLWTRESHWNYKARNRNGGAYGIAQAYPAIKLASAGSDWQTNPATQIRWGLKYIASRYNNNACFALKHSFKKGWY